MEFSKSELQLLKDSWAEISKIGDLEIGIFTLRRIFKLKPEAREMYKVVPGDIENTLQEFKKSRPVRVLSAKYGDYFNQLITNVESPETFQTLIEQLASIHLKHEVDPMHFEIVGDVIVDVISRVMRCDTSCELMQAWTKLGMHVQNSLIRAMKTV